MSASPPIGAPGNGPASGCTRAASCASPHRHCPGSGPPAFTAAVHAAASAPGTAASTCSRRLLWSAARAASGGTGPPSSSQVSLPSQRLIIDSVGASAPDVIHAHVCAPSSGRYSASARARR